MRWIGLAPWEFEFPFPGSHVSAFLVLFLVLLSAAVAVKVMTDAKLATTILASGTPQERVLH